MVLAGYDLSCRCDNAASKTKTRSLLATEMVTKQQHLSLWFLRKAEMRYHDRK